MLFKQFAGIDAYPICVDARTVDELVAIGTALAPTFGGINLEDIAAPACFEVERRLQDAVDIPVFHDDQHGTAIVVLAAALNAARVVGKRLADMTITVVGTGAAGVACARLLDEVGVGDIIGFDREGVLHRGLTGLSGAKRWFADHANRDGRTGGIHDAVKRSDLLLGLSGPGIVEPWMLDRHGRRRHRLRDGQPDAGDHARRRAGERRRGRHRSQRLPEPDQQRPRVPRRLPRPARHGRAALHDRHEARRRPRPRRARARPDARAASWRAPSTPASPPPSPTPCAGSAAAADRPPTAAA